MAEHSSWPRISEPEKYVKAIVGALVAGLTTLATAMGSGVTGQEWLGVAIAVVVTFGGVFGVPNARSATPGQ